MSQIYDVHPVGEVLEFLDDRILCFVYCHCSYVYFEGVEGVKRESEGGRLSVLSGAWGHHGSGLDSS